MATMQAVDPRIEQMRAGVQPAASFFEYGTLLHDFDLELYVFLSSETDGGECIKAELWSVLNRLGARGWEPVLAGPPPVGEYILRRNRFDPR